MTSGTVRFLELVLTFDEKRRRLERFGGGRKRRQRCPWHADVDV